MLGFGKGRRGARAARGGRGCGGPTRSLTACGGPRARAGPRGAADRGRFDPVAAEVAPTWRLRGSHAGRREVDGDVGRNGRWTAAANDGRTTAIQAKASTPSGCTRRGETSQRLGFAGGSSSVEDCGGGHWRREKRGTTTRRLGFDSSGLEHLHDLGIAFLALDWAELHREKLATSGGLQRRAATAARPRRAVARFWAAPASF